MHFRSVRLPDEPVSGRFPAVDDQHGSAIRTSVWHVPPELVFQGLIHWVASHGDETRRTGGVIGKYQSFGGWEIT